MNWFDRTVSWLFPRILFSGTPWKEEWDRQEHEAFLSTVRLFFPSAALIYVAHFHFFDVPMGLEPIGNWFLFRYGTAAMSLLAMAFYFSPFRNVVHYKWLAGGVCAFYCFAQAQVAVSYGNEAWVFCFVLVAVSIQILKEPVANSLLVGGVIIAIITPTLLQSGAPIANVISGSLATFAAIFALRSSYIKDVQNFLLNKEYLANQEHLVELNRDFTDRIRSFIPTVISNRLEHFVTKSRMSIIEASVEVLRAQEKSVSCLFSDIRGYTQSSKDLDSYIRHSAIPEMRVCSSIIERMHGIPRKIGDLIFAYFDDSASQANVLRAVEAAIDMSRANEAMNATLNRQQIDRYILISTGKAIVGNIGGVDSSVEITALGSPVNFLSRLDELTKTQSLNEMLKFGDIIICSNTNDILRQLVPELKILPIDICNMNISIRDFSEVKEIFVIKPTNSNLSLVKQANQFSGDTFENATLSRFRKIA